MTLPIVSGVDPRIQNILNRAATYLPQGYSIKMTSGYRGPTQHNHNGNAADYQIYGPNGAIANRGDDPTGMYKTLAQHTLGVQRAMYPELNGQFNWGGAHSVHAGGPGPRDLMHWDINGERGRYSDYLLSRMGAVPGVDYGAGASPSPSPSPSQSAPLGNGILGQAMNTLQGKPQPSAQQPPASVLMNAMAQADKDTPETPADTESADTSSSSGNSLMSQIGKALTPRFIKDPNYSFGDALSNAGAAMMALDNAAGAKVLSEQAKHPGVESKKAKMTEWSFEPTTGTFFRTNPETGKLETAQGNKKEQESELPNASEGALKQVDDKVETYNYLAQSAKEASELVEMIDRGELDLGFARNYMAKGQNTFGTADKHSLAYSKYDQFFHGLVAAELRLNAGVQTEGDAYRALQRFAAGGAHYSNEAAREALTRIIDRSKDAVLSNGVGSFKSHMAAYRNGKEAFAGHAKTVAGWQSLFDDIDSRMAQSRQKPAPGNGAFQVVPNQPRKSNAVVVGQPF